MNGHLIDTQLNDYVDGDLARDAWDAALVHLGGCAPCRDRLFALGAVVRAAGALPRESEPSPSVRDAVVASARQRSAASGVPPQARPRWPALARPLAAAAVLVVAGFAAGRALGPFDAPPARESARDGAYDTGTALDPALAVQRSGTAYVTALAALRGVAESTPGPEVSQGREAALASLYAAAAEFSRLLPDDPDAERLLRAAEATRRRALAEGLHDAVRF